MVWEGSSFTTLDFFFPMKFAVGRSSGVALEVAVYVLKIAIFDSFFLVMTALEGVLFLRSSFLASSFFFSSYSFFFFIFSSAFLIIFSSILCFFCIFNFFFWWCWGLFSSDELPESLSEISRSIRILALLSSSSLPFLIILSRRPSSFFFYFSSLSLRLSWIPFIKLSKSMMSF